MPKADDSLTWKRTLFERQPHKDTFHDRSFLRSLRLRSDARPSTRDAWRWDVVWYIVHTLSVPFFLLALQAVLRGSVLTPRELLALELCSSVFWWVAHLAMQFIASGKLELDIVKVWALFLVCFRITAPALQTLTLSFSDDTVLAVIVTLFTAHVVFKRTGTHLPYDSSTISLSAAMFAVLMLASRLTHPNSVVVFLLVSVQLLVYLPKVFLENSLIFVACTTLVLFAMTSAMLLRLDPKAFYLFLVCIFLVAIVGPIMYNHISSRQSKLRVSIP